MCTAREYPTIGSHVVPDEIFCLFIQCSSLSANGQICVVQLGISLTSGLDGVHLYSVARTVLCNDLASEQKWDLDKTRSFSVWRVNIARREVRPYRTSDLHHYKRKYQYAHHRNRKVVQRSQGVWLHHPGERTEGLLRSPQRHQRQRLQVVD